MIKLVSILALGVFLFLVGLYKVLKATKTEGQYRDWEAEKNRNKVRNDLIVFRTENNLTLFNSIPSCCREMKKRGWIWTGVGVSTLLLLAVFGRFL